MKRVLVAGGGTGGHIAPALAVGRRIVQEGWAEVFYARTERPVDMAMYGPEGSRVFALRSPRIDKGARILLPFTAGAALAGAVKLVRSLGADAVLGTGGYASFYCVAGAWLSGVPGFVLDTNALPGRSNRWVSRFCRLAFAAFPGQERYFHCPVSTVGIPRNPRGKAAGARERLGIPADARVVLFLGGSQGASALNDLAAARPPGIRLLLQCGARDEARMTGLLDGREGFTVRGFVDDLSDWYSAADLAVARAGAQTMAELSAFELPAVFIPYPFAADDHQTANARVAAEAGAAVLMRQDRADSAGLWNMVEEILDDSPRLAAMVSAMGSLLPGNSAERVSAGIRGMCG
jgi:UDP-N-acetylglucosamine--N-acetylmuramyl-(pentapeptide) pyrophosphoryl-undecaprenol N-acetylglucosamine transferase